MPDYAAAKLTKDSRPGIYKYLFIFNYPVKREEYLERSVGHDMLQKNHKKRALTLLISRALTKCLLGNC